ncbi:aspartate/glutamate racemase family protein [Rhodobacteraceae bacterium F11138]|nr:aspartate/glutamate racemase family protein [Rhodobacteraceae bacterium F11138]
MSRILVINPNSNDEVTRGIALSLAGLDLPNGFGTECVTLAEGPFGVETQEDVDAVVDPLRRMILKRSDCSAFVIACYSDPGLSECRAACPDPVAGIQESAVTEAISLGGRFGVIALGPQSIERHARYMTAMGVMDRLAGERPLRMTVAEGEQPEAFGRICDVARELRDIDKADSIILGCAGMARHRERLEAVLERPVIDPTRAAVIRLARAPSTALAHED